jgi:hypothetical protein
MKPKAIIENLINGNLSDAVYNAKYTPTKDLIAESENLGYSYNQALLMACYLKGIISFQEYCDSLNNTK